MGSKEKATSKFFMLDPRKYLLIMFYYMRNLISLILPV